MPPGWNAVPLYSPVWLPASNPSHIHSWDLHHPLQPQHHHDFRQYLRRPRTEQQQHYRWNSIFMAYIYYTPGTMVRTSSVISFSPPSKLTRRYYYYPHFTDEETEVPESYVNCHSPLSLSCLDQDWTADPSRVTQILSPRNLGIGFGCLIVSVGHSKWRHVN